MQHTQNNKKKITKSETTVYKQKTSKVKTKLAPKSNIKQKQKQKQTVFIFVAQWLHLTLLLLPRLLTASPSHHLAAEAAGGEGLRASTFSKQSWPSWT